MISLLVMMRKHRFGELRATDAGMSVLIIWAAKIRFCMELNNYEELLIFKTIIRLYSG